MINRVENYMDPINSIKIITTIITVIVAFTLGFQVLRLNLGELLNIWFIFIFDQNSYMEKIFVKRKLK